jgi:hypothetical protein
MKPPPIENLMTRFRLIGRLLTVTAMAVALLPARVQAADPPKPDQADAAAVTVGQPQWLEAGGERFLGIYTTALTGAPLGAAIILPGLGLPPDWPDVIAPLRTGLPGYGWNTLSIPLPTPTRGADGRWQLDSYFTASRTRIQAAMAFLQQQGITRIVLIGQGLGAAAAVVSISGNDALRLAACAAVSLGVPPDAAPSPYRPGLVENIRVPLLDIFGSRDLDWVTSTAAARLTAARRGGHAASRLQATPAARPPAPEQNRDSAYRQFQVVGADHRFRGAETVLLNRVVGWLKNHAGMAVAAGTQ